MSKISIAVTDQGGFTSFYEFSTPTRMAAWFMRYRHVLNISLTGPLKETLARASANPYAYIKCAAGCEVIDCDGNTIELTVFVAEAPATHFIN